MNPLELRIDVVTSYNLPSPFTGTWEHHHMPDLDDFTCQENGRTSEITDAMAKELNGIAICMALPCLVTGGKTK